MKKIIANEQTSVRTAISTSLRAMNRDAIQVVGNVETVSRMLRQHRLSKINPKPYTIESLRLSLNLTKPHRNEFFYQYGPERFGIYDIHDDFILFFSRYSAEKLLLHNVWCVDGTFSVVPKPYCQLYTISYLKNHHVYPVIFGILKNKKETTYNNFFATIKRMIPNLDPAIIKTDFESAAINALKTNWPNAKFSGCQFHLGQNIIRRLKKNGQYQQYLSNPVVNFFVKALMALSYVRPEKVLETFLELKNHSTFPSQLSELYEYFKVNYIYSLTGVSYPINMWNCQDCLTNDVPQTNSAIEGWHNVFNDTFGTSKFNFPLLILKLKHEEEVIQQRIGRDESNETFRRKFNYLRMEEALIAFINSVGDRFGFEYIRNLVSLIYY